MPVEAIDSMTVLNWIVSVIWVMLAWILRVIWTTVRDIQRDLRKIQSEFPEQYLRKDDFREIMKDHRDHLTENFLSINTKLAGLFKKMDRHKHQHKCLWTGGKDVHFGEKIAQKLGGGPQQSIACCGEGYSADND